MARSIPKFDGGVPTAPLRQSPETPQSYDIEVITPLCGGGVQSAVNDPITLIRPSSIRGHLRFWWRATRGSDFSDFKAMRQREAEIWGSTATPSKVAVRVEILSKGEEKGVGKFHLKTDKNGNDRYDFKFNDDLPDYAAFPFRQQYDPGESTQENTKLIPKVHLHVKFKLYLDYPESLKTDIESDLIDAVTAWVNFGGIGARTRRGFGALYCSELAIDRSLIAFQKSGTPSQWPVLCHDYEMSSGKDSLAAWREGISKLQSFRQSNPLGRRNGSDPRNARKLGRSNWPEAEAVRNLVFEQRNLTTRPTHWHDPDTILFNDRSELGEYPQYFPRAEFGLPIIFEIRGETVDGSQDNLKPTLQYDENHDRLASPLIIRPIKFKDDTICCLFLRLRTPILNQAYLREGNNDLTQAVIIDADQIRNPALSRYRASPLGPPPSGGNPRSSAGSALDAFFAYLRHG